MQPLYLPAFLTRRSTLRIHFHVLRFFLFSDHLGTAVPQDFDCLFGFFSFLFSTFMSSVAQSVAGSSLSPNPPSRSASRLSSTSGKGRLVDKSSVTPPKRPHSTQPRLTRSSTPAQADGEDGTAWGANFWVTLVDPQVRSGDLILNARLTAGAQTNTAFYACPATGHVSWDAPVGNFVCVGPR